MQSVLNWLRENSVPGSHRLKTYSFIKKGGHGVTRHFTPQLNFIVGKVKKQNTKKNCTAPDLLPDPLGGREVRTWKSLSLFDRNKSSERMTPSLCGGFTPS